MHLQERLRNATQGAQQQHDRVSKVLLDPLNKSVAPQSDMDALNAVAAHLSDELQMVLAGGLRDKSPDVIAARKMLASVQDQISAHKAEALTALRAAMVEAREGRLTEPLQAAVEAASKVLGDDAAAAESIGEANSLIATIQSEKENIAKQLVYLGELVEYVEASPLQEQFSLATHDLQAQLTYLESIGTPPLSPEIVAAQALLKKIEDRASSAENQLRQTIEMATQRTITSEALEKKLFEELAAGLTESHAVVSEAYALIDRLRIQEEMERAAAVRIQTRVRIILSKKIMDAKRLDKEKELMDLFGELQVAYQAETDSEFKHNEEIEKNTFLDQYSNIKYLWDEHGEVSEYAIKAILKVQAQIRR